MSRMQLRVMFTLKIIASRGYHMNIMLLLEGKDQNKIRRKKRRTVFSQRLKIWFKKVCYNRDTDNCFLTS